jgi:hypothetical protein
LDAARLKFDTALSNIRESNNRIGGRLKMVLADRSLIERYGVSKGPMSQPESIKYIADVLEMAYENMVNGVKKEIFSIQFRYLKQRTP